MSHAHAHRVALFSVLASLLLSACSEHTDVTEPGDDRDVTTIGISDFSFSAPTVTIDRGQSVRWRVSTNTFHTVTPDGHQAFAGRQLNGAGQIYEVRFDTPGRYRYYCEPHRALGMTGEVVVQ